MRNLIRIQMFFLLLFASGGAAQDMHFTQFYSTPLFLNPAFTGADVCSRVSLAYRNQWPGIQQTYRSYLFSVDHFFLSKNIGAGILFGSDVAGSGDLKTTIVNVPVAYEAKLTKKLYVRMGVQPGFEMRSINYNKLLFGDQIARGGAASSVENPTVNASFFDVGAGVLFYTRRYWAGLSVHHLNKPTESLMEDADVVRPMKLGIHGGAKFVINEDEKDEKNRRYISPAFNYRHQAKFDQLDIGFYMTQSVLNVGVWYRGIPLFKSYGPGYANNDAIALIVGVRGDRYSFGYSYDITISRLAGLSKGAHEITASYQLCKLKKKKKPRMLTPCPKF